MTATHISERSLLMQGKELLTAAASRLDGKKPPQLQHLALLAPGQCHSGPWGQPSLAADPSAVPVQLAAGHPPQLPPRCGSLPGRSPRAELEPQPRKEAPQAAPQWWAPCEQRTVRPGLTSPRRRLPARPWGTGGKGGLAQVVGWGRELQGTSALQRLASSSAHALNPRGGGRAGPALSPSCPPRTCEPDSEEGPRPAWPRQGHHNREAVWTRRHPGEARGTEAWG